MKNSGFRWTLILSAGLAALILAGTAYRSGVVDEGPPRKPSPVTSYGGVEPREESPAAAPVAPEPAPVPRPAPVERRKAREEGYREAREASWEGSLSGQVVSPEGPLPGFTVRVEWVLAHQPDRDESVRLKRIGARRDRDGTWWASALVSTDDSGCFTVDGLPAVPLRVHAGSAVQQAQVGTFARLQTERPQ